MSGSVAIIDYGSGNLRSAAKAFERMAAETGHRVLVTSDPREVENAERIVLPGVGAFADCMRGLSALPGMVDTLRENVLQRSKPFLGICVGMQLLADKGFENGEHKGLGWIAGEVKKLVPSDASLKIPHMGWNGLRICAPHPILTGIGEDAHMYFVHSYHFISKDNVNIVAETEYGGRVAAVLAQDTIAATQFHPEKSQEAGLRLIGNFLRWKP